MGSNTWFIVKVLIISAGLSTLIKYGGPMLFISATATNVLIAVFLPALLMLFTLGWRARQQH